MKKITLATAVLLTGVLLVTAQEDGSAQIQAQEQVIAQVLTQWKGQSQGEGVMNPKIEQVRAIVTASNIRPLLDEATQEKLKVLNIEMEAKIKVIRDQYLVKLKVLLGDKLMMMTQQVQTAVQAGQAGTEGIKSIQKAINGTTNRQGRDTIRILPSLKENGGEIKGVVKENGGEVKSTITTNKEVDLNVEIQEKVMKFLKGLFGGI